MKLSRIKMLFAKPSNAVSYDIEPNVYVVSKNKDGLITTGIIYLSAYKNEDGERTIIALAPSSSTVSHFVQYSIDGGAWTTCANIRVSESVTVYGVHGSIVSTITSGITFRLCHGTSTDYDVLKTNGTLPVVKDGINGNSPWLANLDNQMDSISCDGYGYPAKDQSVYTTILSREGSVSKSFTISSVVRKYGSNNASSEALAVNASGYSTGVKVAFNSTTNALTISYNTAAQITGKDIVVITIASGSDTRTLEFTINAIEGDVYNLLPKDKEIVCDIDLASGNLISDVSANSNWQTTKDGNTIKTSGVNADTAFNIISKETITPGTNYVFGFYVDGWSGTGEWVWYASNNSSCMKLTIKSNGWCWGYGSLIPASGSANTTIGIDDSTRSVYPALTLSRFTLLKTDSLSFTVNGSNVFPLTCGYTKRVDNNETTVEKFTGILVDSKYDIFYCIHYRGGDWARYLNSGSNKGHKDYYRFIGADMEFAGEQRSQSSINLNVVDAVEFVLVKYGSAAWEWADEGQKVIDRQIVYVKEKYKNVAYEFQFTEAYARLTNSNVVEGNLEGYAYKRIGDGEKIALANTTIRYGYILDDSQTYYEESTDANGHFDTQEWFTGDEYTDPGVKSSPSIFAAIIIDGAVVHVEHFNIVKEGKNTPWYYYDGAFDSTKEYIGTLKNAPWVSLDVTENGVTTTYGYMLIASTNLVNESLVAPRTAAAAGVWELMTSSFKWLITESVFAPFAKLGGLIIKDNYMISQLGIDGTTNYQNFTGESGSWKPMLLINAATGAGWLAGGNIRFNTDGSGSIAGGKISWNSGGLNVQGKIHANLMYADTKEISASYTVNPSTEPYYCYLVRANSEQELVVTLPNASTYDGLELRFYSWISARLGAAGRLYYSGGIVVKTSNYIWTETATKVELPANNFVTVKAMRGVWFVVAGDVEVIDSLYTINN